MEKSNPLHKDVFWGIGFIILTLAEFILTGKRSLFPPYFLNILIVLYPLLLIGLWKCSEANSFIRTLITLTRYAFLWCFAGYSLGIMMFFRMNISINFAAQLLLTVYALFVYTILYDLTLTPQINYKSEIASKRIMISIIIPSTPFS